MNNDHEVAGITIAVISAVFACVVSYNMGSNSAKTQILAKCIQKHEDKPVVEVKQICNALLEK